MPEYHVASFIVRCHGIDLHQTIELISHIDNAEVHSQDPHGKIIMTAEGERHKDISIIVETIRDLPTVVDVAAVYHEYSEISDTENRI